MTYKEYIKDERIALFSACAAYVPMLGVLLLTRVPLPGLLLVSALWLAGFIVPHVLRARRKHAFYTHMRETMDQLDVKYHLSDLVKSPGFFDGDFALEMLSEARAGMTDRVNAYRISQKEYKEFIELWIHQVKTPLSSCLMMTGAGTDDAMTEGLMQITGYVEQALFYARSGYAEQDYLIRDVNLRQVVNGVIVERRQRFLQHGVRADVQLTDETVKSDGKWLAFIIGQIIDNALQYTQAGTGLVTVSCTSKEASLILSISDNGIGIADKDIGRVFDKGFTGDNGRTNRRSTGLGLYLCKRLCDKLHLGIDISSGGGTTVRIWFPSGEQQTK